MSVSKLRFLLTLLTTQYDTNCRQGYTVHLEDGEFGIMLLLVQCLPLPYYLRLVVIMYPYLSLPVLTQINLRSCCAYLSIVWQYPVVVSWKVTHPYNQPLTSQLCWTRLPIPLSWDGGEEALRPRFPFWDVVIIATPFRDGGSWSYSALFLEVSGTRSTAVKTPLMPGPSRHKLIPGYRMIPCEAYLLVSVLGNNVPWRSSHHVTK